MLLKLFWKASNNNTIIVIIIVQKGYYFDINEMTTGGLPLQENCAIEFNIAPQKYYNLNLTQNPTA